MSRQAGGMGEVWFGYDKRLDRPVAVKFIRIDRQTDGRPDDELTKRFVRESRITARLEHPGVPVVYDCGSHGEELYLVMQLVNGCPVSSLLDETEVPVAWAVAIAAQVCSVLAVAHANSLVHRDLKPSNLMLCPDGTVKVLDFGIVAALGSNAVTKLTATGIVVGSPDYMAPEQAMGEATSRRSDLYSLGVVLDEMLSGKNQFAGPTALASMRNHTDVPPRPLRTRRREVPEGLERLVLWLLAKEPEKRPPSADVVYRRLMDFCRDLPAFPGYVNLGAPHPVRMYAAVVGRIAAEPPAAGPVAVVSVGVRPVGSATGPAADRPLTGKARPERLRDGAGAESPRPGSPRDAGGRRGDAGPAAGQRDAGQEAVASARKDAEALKAESRFTQAADVLAEAVEPAVRALGPKDSGVIDLRIELADALFLGGDYRRAAPEFGRLVADLADREGPEHDLVLRCRLMEANCHAAVGETNLALAQLGGLLDDERRFGVDEERMLELRRQIGLLELGSGRRSRAKVTLSDLLRDLEGRYGSRHPTVEKVREILESLDGR
ncbi:protein kinase [Streptosporangium sp. NBC_01755]|uniref:serine/threonine-protein kinase n=1 Tax=unclassified Streptosporangium TaxID=2632669 RepID=UPI002DD902C5|nr:MULTISPECIES: protein kinase [unclassified Streptosporangium]WSA26798.1 protein kinase [Streptosporangium sp. NBC_01810]WSD01777.1 protein kinase [Streptosporangium sp. NBC_01755]